MINSLKSPIQFVWCRVEKNIS